MTTTLFPKFHTGKAIKQLGVKFDCYYCELGKIRLDGEASKRATEGRVRRKCPVCSEWLSFTFDGGDVIDVKGESLSGDRSNE